MHQCVHLSFSTHQYIVTIARRQAKKYQPITWSDSISRSTIFQAETAPLDHTAWYLKSFVLVNVDMQAFEW
jgi:hypothetical protein